MSQSNRRSPTHSPSLERPTISSFGSFIPFFTAIDYSTGFVAFSVVVLVRFSLNLYTNNALNLTPEQFESYPFRIP
jgi:hypothetical protein